MGAFKKVLIYEGKKLLFFPFLFFLFATAHTGLNLIGVWNFSAEPTRIIELEVWSMQLFCIFCFLLLALAVYRTFAVRKLYEKVRIKAETVFLARCLLLTLATWLYLLVALALGSIRVGTLEVNSTYPFVFTLLRKPWWYAILFPLSVVTSLLTAYSLAELIKNILVGRMRVIFKVLAMLLPALLVIFLHAAPQVTLDWYTIGNNDYFMGQMPVGEISYGLYMDMFSCSDLLHGVTDYKIPYCMLSWNIYNLPLLLAAVVCILIGYFSFAFFGLKKNESYLYSSQKGGKKHDDGEN